MNTAKAALRQEFADPEARRDYAEIFLNSAIALQIKVLRQQRGWDQAELAKRAGLHQSQISAMEKSTHNAWTLRTLKKLAHAFDLALVVRFDGYGELLDYVTSMSRQALERPSFQDDSAFKPHAEDVGLHSTPVLQAESDRGASTSLSQPIYHAKSTTVPVQGYAKMSLPGAAIQRTTSEVAYLPHTSAAIGRGNV